MRISSVVSLLACGLPIVFGGTSEEYDVKATQHMLRGEYEQALQEYRAAVRRNPQDHASYSNFG